MRNTIYINFIFTIFLTISCEKGIPETDISCNELKEENGLIYMNTKKFSGSCYTTYDLNLEKDEIRSYKNGQQHGIWVKYHLNGIIDYLGNAKNGLIHGEYSSFYPDGTPKEKGEMKKGYREGEWVLYNENGELIRSELHKNRALISSFNH
jgi:antitoxin component YwqK of YwqJK toxin-antitoxin module